MILGNHATFWREPDARPTGAGRAQLGRGQSQGMCVWGGRARRCVHAPTGVRGHNLVVGVLKVDDEVDGARDHEEEGEHARDDEDHVGAIERRHVRPRAGAPSPCAPRSAPRGEERGRPQYASARGGRRWQGEGQGGRPKEGRGSGTRNPAARTARPAQQQAAERQSPTESDGPTAVRRSDSRPTKEQSDRADSKSKRGSPPCGGGTTPAPLASRRLRARPVAGLFF